MNFLAHAFLSPGVDGVMVGNVTADWIKGRARRALGAEVHAGFELHRRIDVFTDLHVVTVRCTEKLAGRWERYAGILVDMFFDHLLAAAWGEFAERPLREFAADVYRRVIAALPGLPEGTAFPVYAMAADDWLTSYAEPDGLRLALTRMSERLRPRPYNRVVPAVDDLHADSDYFREAFREFFPELRGHVNEAEMMRGPA